MCIIKNRNVYSNRHWLVLTDNKKLVYIRYFTYEIKQIIGLINHWRSTIMNHCIFYIQTNYVPGLAVL